MKKYAIMGVFPCSSMVEQEAVNFEVASSSLAGGAIFLFKNKNSKRGRLVLRLRLRIESGRGSHFFMDKKLKKRQTRTYAFGSGASLAGGAIKDPLVAKATC